METAVPQGLETSAAMQSYTVPGADRRYCFSFIIDGIKVKAFCDPGSIFSYLSSNIAEQLEDKLEGIEYTYFLGANRSYPKVTGLLLVAIELQGKIKIHELRVVDDLHYDEIFGLDFLKK